MKQFRSTLLAGAAVALMAATLPAMAQDATTQAPAAGTTAAPANAAPDAGAAPASATKHHKKRHRHSKRHKKAAAPDAGQTDAAPAAPDTEAPAK